MKTDMITAAKLAEIHGVTRQAIMKRSKKEKWPFENGKNRAKKFIVSGLPEEIRMAISAEKVRDITPYIYKESKSALPVPVGDPELPEWKNRIALARADLIRAYLVEKDRAKSAGERMGDAAKMFMAGYNSGILYPGLFEILGKKNVKTVDAWVKKFRDSNYDFAVLGTGYGNRLGQRKILDDEFNVALSYALHPNRLRISEISRLTKMTLSRKQIDSPSSDATIRRSIEDWKKTHYDQWVFAREGKKALNDKCLFYLERDIGALDVGDVLVADGHTLNFQSLDPFTGKPKRLTMLMWYDWASCMPVGWDLMPTENIQCVAASLRRAILTIGKMPKVAYLDNGRAFKAKVFTSKEVDFEEAGFYGMFARLGIETLFAWPYNAQSKVVERFFGTFNELERLLPTYTGASITDKPAHMHRNEKLHKRIHEKKYGGWVPTVEETNRIIMGWIGEYMNRPHRGLKGICPAEILTSGRGPGIDDVALRFLMMSMGIKSVGRNGVRFNGRNYYDEALYGYGDRVLVRYDLEDLSEIYVYDQAGCKLLCAASPVEPVHPVARLLGTKDDVDAVKAGIELKRHLQKKTETSARAFVENAPDLVVLPFIEKPSPKPKKEKPKALPRAEAEQIEREAAKMKVVDLTPRAPEQVWESESDRYEVLLERDCKGDELELDDMAWMRYYEKTKEYKMFKDRFEFLRELYIAGPADAERAGN